MIILVFIVGFGTHVVISINRESKILLEQQREKARLFNETVMVGIGSEDRMDFTVIGDAVNLGARLCSAAERGQVIVSEYAAKYIMNDGSITLTKLEPIKVKGKESFIEIYEAKAKK